MLGRIGMVGWDEDATGRQGACGTCSPTVQRQEHVPGLRKHCHGVA